MNDPWATHGSALQTHGRPMGDRGRPVGDPWACTITPWATDGMAPGHRGLTDTFLVVTRGFDSSYLRVALFWPFFFACFAAVDDRCSCGRDQGRQWGALWMESGWVVGLRCVFRGRFQFLHPVGGIRVETSAPPISFPSIFLLYTCVISTRPVGQPWVAHGSLHLSLIHI